MPFLFGSQPKVVQSGPQPTTDSNQQGIAALLAHLLSAGTQPAGVQAYGGTFAAPTSPLQNTALGGLQGAAGGVGPTGAATGATGDVFEALRQALAFHAPQIAAPQAGAPAQTSAITAPAAAQVAPTAAPQSPLVSALSVNPTSVATPTIDASRAFQTGVAQPIIDDFTSQILPAISGAAGKSAGGAYSSDTELARAMATKQLGRTLAQQGSLYDFSAQQANQGAALTTGVANQADAARAALANQGASLAAGTANQGATTTVNLANAGTANAVGLANAGATNATALENARTANTVGLSNTGAVNTTNLANLGVADTTGRANQGAALTGQADVLSALGIAPSEIALPQTQNSSTIDQLLRILSGGGVQQQTAQAQATGQYNDFLNQITQGNSLRQLMAAFGLSPTQQNTSVAQAGSTGLIPGIASGLASNSAVGTGIGSAMSTLAPMLLSMLSDERAKDDLVQIGEVAKLPIYRYRYKGEPANIIRVGFTAQDVEKRVPSAVSTRHDGLKQVDYARTLEMLLAA